MEKNVHDVLEKIKNVLNGSHDDYYKMLATQEIDILESTLRYIPQEWRGTQIYNELINEFIPPETEVDYKVLSIWTDKSIEALKEELSY